MGSFDQKFLFVSGKGGVGKTTASVAIAQHLAAGGRRVLLALSEAPAAARLLGRAPSTRVETFAPGLDVVGIEPEVALQEYASIVLGGGVAVASLVNNRYSRSFLKAVPGLYQWAVLGKAWYHTTEEVDGKPRFDTVVFDAPATGHGLEMLQVPQVICEAAPPGPLRRDAERAWLLFQDPTKSAVLVVSLPEELPVNESIELADGIRGLGFPVAAGILNGRLPPLSPPLSASQLEPHSELSGDGQRVLQVARRRVQQEAEQARQEARFRLAFSVPVWVLPWLANADTPSGARALAGVFDTSRT